MSMRLSNYYKLCCRSIKCALCLTVCAVILFTSFPAILQTSAEIPETVICNDDFNREDSDSIGNQWMDITAGNSTIANQALVLKASAKDKTAENRVQRPEGEESINQKVSVDFTVEDLIDGKRPLIWLRSQNAQPNGVAGYFLTWEGNGSGYGNYVRIYKRVAGSSSFTKVSEQMYNINFTNGSWTGKIRFDVDVSGTFPTSFYVTAYSESLNWTASWSLGSDSTAELQNAGSVGLSAYTLSGEESVMTFDNFKYSAADIKRTTTVITEKFDRLDSDTVGNGWIENPGDSFAIQENQLQVTLPDQAVSTTYLLRPTTESSINQSITISVPMDDIRAGRFPVLWLRANQAESGKLTGYFMYWNGSNIIMNAALADGTIVQGTKTLLNKMTWPDVITLTFSASGDGTKTTLKGSINHVDTSGDNNYGSWLKPAGDAVFSTPELQTAGTVAISGFENTSQTKPKMLMDNFSYITELDGTPLYEKVQEAEAVVKAGIGYTQSSFELIKQEIKKANEVIKNFRTITAPELMTAMASLQAALDTALELPKMAALKVNGNEPKAATYNSYNITVGKEVDTLDFAVTAEDENDIVTVVRDATQTVGNTQEFSAEHSETYTVKITSPTQEEAVSSFGVTVYRSDSAFVEFTDDFERRDGILGNGWIEETSDIARIFDGNMRISCGGVTSNSDVYKHRMIRPYEESTQDQYLVVDIPVESLQDGAIPRFWLRLQQDGDSNPTNNNGYYVSANFKDGITIGKRLYGEDIQIHKITHRPNLSLYEGVFRFEILIRGTDTTEIRVRVKNNAPKSGGEQWRVSEICKDSSTPIKTAGTVGISYGATKSDCLVSHFYYCDYQQPDYMIHVIGKSSISYFGQWLDLNPDETYVYTYEVCAANELGQNSIMPTLQYANYASNPYDLFYFKEYSRDLVNKSFIGTFQVPADALKQLDGNVAVRVGFTTGRNGAEAYIHNIRVYKQSDESKTNLLKNSDFAKGMYGWIANGKSFEPVLSEAILASNSCDVELEKYDPSVFAKDESVVVEDLYPNYKGDYMLYSSGEIAWPEFTQYVNVIPGETYMFTYYYNFIANNWIQPFANFYTGDTLKSTRLTFEYKETDGKNCLISVEFIVPTNVKLNPDGTTTINIGINLGQKGSIAYFYKPALYLKRDSAKKNLFYNADFKRGLEGWSASGTGTFGVTVPGVLKGPVNGEVELQPVELAYFNLGDVDDDGEWWREFYPNGLPGSQEQEDDTETTDYALNHSPSSTDWDDDEETDTDFSDVGDELEEDENKTANPNTKTSSRSTKKQDNREDYTVLIVIAAAVSAALLIAVAVILILQKKRKISSE